MSFRQGSAWSSSIIPPNGFYEVVPPVASTAPYNQITRIYADPGTIITAEAVQSSGTSSSGDVILSGHYVSVH